MQHAISLTHARPTQPCSLWCYFDDVLLVGLLLRKGDRNLVAERCSPMGLSDKINIHSVVSDNVLRWFGVMGDKSHAT